MLKLIAASPLSRNDAAALKATGKVFKSTVMSTTPGEFVQTLTPFMRAVTAKPHATVLLAEDDRSLRRYFEIILRRDGYTVITAADGLEAMKAVLSLAVDAVVTDAVMPHLSGHELCRFLRRHPSLSRLPVVLLSGADKTRSQDDASVRADAYLSKPVRPEELTDCLSRLLAEVN